MRLQESILNRFLAQKREQIVCTIIRWKNHRNCILVVFKPVRFNVIRRISLIIKHTNIVLIKEVAVITKMTIYNC